MTVLARKGKKSIHPAAAGPAGGSVRVFHKAKPAIPQISEQTRRTFAAISDPANAHAFSVHAALKAFASVKI